MNARVIHTGFPIPGIDPDLKESNPKEAFGSTRLPMHMVPDTLGIYAAMAFAEGDSKYIAYNFRIAGVRVTHFREN